MPNVDRFKLEVRRSARPAALVSVLIVLAGLAAGGIAKNLTFQRPWQDYRTIKAHFDDVKGIFPGGHQVRLNGVKIGVVKAADLEDGNAVLTLQLEKKWGPIYRNAKMRIRPVTPLQDLYVNITDRGTPDAGEATTASIIPAEQTVTPVDISRVLNTFNADTRDRMKVLLSELGRGLHDNGEQLRATFAQLAPFLHAARDVTRVLNRHQAGIKRVVTNFGKLNAELADRDADLNAFVRQGNGALGELARNDAPLAATFTSLAALLPAMRSSFSTVEGLTQKLDPALKSLEPVTDDLEKGLDGLQALGEDATPALRELRPATKDLRTMARALAPVSTALDRSFARLRKQAPQYDQITRDVLPCLLDGTLLRFFNNTLSVFKFEDGYGAFPRAETTLDADALARTDGSDAKNAANLRKMDFCSDRIGG